MSKKTSFFVLLICFHSVHFFALICLNSGRFLKSNGKHCFSCKIGTFNQRHFCIYLFILFLLFLLSLENKNERKEKKKIKCLVAMVATESNHKSKLMVTQGNFDFQVKVINDEFRKENAKHYRKDLLLLLFYRQSFKTDFFSVSVFLFLFNEQKLSFLSRFLLTFFLCKILIQK